MMTKINRAWGTTALGAAAGMAAVASPSQGQQAVYPAPTFDRWMYPFNSQPGVRPDALIFGVLGPQGVGQFDDRDGQLLVTWSTGGEFQPGLGAANYRVLSARVTATIDPRFGDAFFYDPTIDSFERISIRTIRTTSRTATPGGPSNFRDGVPQRVHARVVRRVGPVLLRAPPAGFRNPSRSIDQVVRRTTFRPLSLPMAVGAGPGRLAGARGQTMVFDLDVNDPLVAASRGRAERRVPLVHAHLAARGCSRPATIPRLHDQGGTLQGDPRRSISAWDRAHARQWSLLLAAMGARAAGGDVALTRRWTIAASAIARRARGLVKAAEPSSTASLSVGEPRATTPPPAR